MRRLKLREAKSPAQGHVAGRWWNWVSRPRKSLYSLHFHSPRVLLKNPIVSPHHRLNRIPHLFTRSILSVHPKDRFSESEPPEWKGNSAIPNPTVHPHITPCCSLACASPLPIKQVFNKQLLCIWNWGEGTRGQSKVL